ncbi:selenocysteine-specific translation elongation factor [Gemmata sp.]|uniref:selenocysteine-specific translation elongation factor n=1 Tax=Gemmata sp. TaxID=1914242 RepID=UPI003F6EC1CF
MPRDLILGTAGHIDHGKTALVRALTGTDCDRLPEEKERGITIDIGFARLPLGGTTLGVVDVPGHERFVRNMLAGATGVDLALLVVAADDGVMPQTREHLDILKFLGVRCGVVALTKADLVGDAARDERVREVRELVRDSFLADAPIVPTSVVAGTGIEELKAALAAAAVGVEREADAGPFRLAIDRAFVVQGHGTVVTGSVASGLARVEDELDWHKGDGTVERVRVRGLSNHGQATDDVHRGQRAGLNLAGVRHDAVRRGQELCAPGYLVPSTVLTVRLFVAAGGRTVKHRLPLRFHAGTAEVMGTVSLLDCDRTEPGQSAVAQLFLDEPVTTVCGQAFVVRDSSAEHTLGGGQVLQPVAHKIRRRQIEVIERVEQLEAADPATRVLAAAWLGGTEGVTPFGLAREAAVLPAAAEALVRELLASGALLELALADGRRVCLHADRVAELEGRALDALAALHAENPLATTHDRQKVLARLGYVGDNPLLDAVVGRLLAAKRLVGDSRRLARADFVPKLSANQRKLKDRIVAAHAAAGFAPPEPAGFANLAGGNAVALKEIFEVAVAEGLLVRVTDDIYLSPEAEAELRRRVSERLASGPGLTVAEVRDLLGTTRKFAVPICEYLDRTGLTRRDGDLRVPATN